MISKDRLFLVLIGSFFLLLIACEQERDPCLQPITATMRVIAKQPLTDTTSIDTLLPHPVWFRVDTAIGLLYSKETARFSLLLSPLADSATYVLAPDSAAIASKDTLTFFYERKLQFLSNACGFTYFYSLQKIRSSSHNIDSVKIVNNDVNLNASSPEHVQIFF
jgi:hypothetical protein